MKLLKEFKDQPLVEEEKTDYSKFDVLVRAGLANKAQMQRIHKILDKMQDDRPQFNNADRMIMQNIFNKMVDLISNNKMIHQQARRAVKESVELDEKAEDITTSDFKLSPSGRKVRAHRFKVGEKLDKDLEIQEETLLESHELPNILVLKRQMVRQFSNKTKIALYYNQRLDKYFSIPYGDAISGIIQAEETEINEAVMDQLHKIVAGKQAQRVKFGDGSTRSVDHYTASAITQVHNALNDENKQKFADMVHKSPAHLAKASDFAFKHTKK